MNNREVRAHGGCDKCSCSNVQVITSLPPWDGISVRHILVAKVLYNGEDMCSIRNAVGCAVVDALFPYR